MTRIPIKIDNCPIIESIFEIRFISNYPPEAVFGIFYQEISTVFKNAELIKLPIMQLPEAVRLSDPNLKYQAHHRLEQANQSIGLGPHVLIFSMNKPYSGWTQWSSFIIDILKHLTKEKVFRKIERTGLRYINVFDDEIFSIAKIKINLNNDCLDKQSTSLRTEMNDEEFIKILNISNNININYKNENIFGSMLDLDIIKKIDLSNDEFKKELKNILMTSHDKEKDLFFNLLTDDYINSLVPHYEEVK